MTLGGCTVKLLKGQMYESCLAEFATIFEERQKDIEGALSMHTAMPTNATINEFTAIPSTTVLLAQAHTLATPSEKELKRYIEAKGGVDKFMLDERALEDLVRIRRTHDQSVPGLVAGDGVTGGSWRPSYIRSSEELRSMSQPIRDYEPISGPRHPSYQPRAVQAGAVERGRRSSRGIIGGRPSSRSHSTSPGPPLRVHGRFYPAWRYGGPPIVLTKLKVIRNELDEDLKDGLARNMFLFQRKLDLQKEKLLGRKATTATIVSEGNLEPHDRIVDPVSSFNPFISFRDLCIGQDLRFIWKDMVRGHVALLVSS
jgi:hypothetical protein